MRDFDHPVVRERGIQAQHPDPFVTELAASNPDAVLAALQTLATRYQRPAMTPEQVLDALANGAAMSQTREIITRLRQP